MTSLLRKSLAILSLSLLVVSGPALAKEDPVYTSFFSNNAAGGYDVTAYFTTGKPVKGSKDFKTEYQGADWLFSSQEALDLFVADPEKYAPQYGGYCAWAVAKGDIASGDPLEWHIHEDRLYLNYNREIRDRWLADKEQFIVDGDRQWPAVLD